MNSMRFFIFLVLIGLDPLYAENTGIETEHPISEKEQHIEKLDTVDVVPNINWHSQLYLENRVMNKVDIKSLLSSIIDEICHKINVIKSIIRAIDLQLKPLLEIHLQDSSIHFTEHKYATKSSIGTSITTVNPVIAVQPNITLIPDITVIPNTTLKPVITVQPLATINPVTIVEPMTTVELIMTSIKSVTVKPNVCVPKVNMKCPESIPIVPLSYQIPLQQQSNYYQSSANKFWPKVNFQSPNTQINYHQYAQYIPSSVFSANPNSYTSGHVHFPEENHQSPDTNYQTMGTNYQNTGMNYNPENPINSNIRPEQSGYTYDRLESTYPRNPVVWPYTSQMDRPEALYNLAFPKSVKDSSLLPIEHRDLSGEQFDLNRFKRPERVQRNDETRIGTNRIPVDRQQGSGAEKNRRSTTTIIGG